MHSQTSTAGVEEALVSQVRQVFPPLSMTGIHTLAALAVLMQEQMACSPMPQCGTGVGLSTQSYGLLIRGSWQCCRIGWKVDVDGVSGAGAACGEVGAGTGKKNFASAGGNVGGHPSISRWLIIAAIFVSRGCLPCAAALWKKPARLPCTAHINCVPNCLSVVICCSITINSQKTCCQRKQRLAMTWCNTRRRKTRRILLWHNIAKTSTKERSGNSCARCKACLVSATVERLLSVRYVSHIHRLLTSCCASVLVSFGNRKGE